MHELKDKGIEKGAYIVLGKTHMAVGIAATLAITQPDSFSEVVLATGVGAIGSLLPDIDVGTSNSHKETERIVRTTILMIVAIFLLEYYLNIDIVKPLMEDHGIAKLVIGALLFLGLCGFGAEQPHRSFMHSFLAMILLSLSLGLVSKNFVPYFAVGFLSHILLDLLNYRKVKIWYPLKRGARLGLCKASGIGNDLFFAAGCTLSVLEIGWFLYQIIL